MVVLTNLNSNTSNRKLKEQTVNDKLKSNMFLCGYLDCGNQLSCF